VMTKRTFSHLNCHLLNHISPTSFFKFECSSLTTQITQSLGLTRAPAPRTLRRVQIYAGSKKKGGGGGGGGGNKKKGSSIPNASPKIARPYLTAPVIMHNLLLIESHFRKTGRLVINFIPGKNFSSSLRF
jgi:hypothetical protein